MRRAKKAPKAPFVFNRKKYPQEKTCTLSGLSEKKEIALQQNDKKRKHRLPVERDQKKKNYFYTYQP
jgi:hypothetical protein